MKKVFGILLTAVMFCSIFSVFTVPAAASPTWDYSIMGSENNDYYVNVYNSKGLKYVLENIPSPSKNLYVTIDTNNEFIDLDPTVISGGGHIIIASNLYPEGHGINGTDKTQPLITITSDDTILTLKNISITNENNDGDGGGLYIKGDNCIINSEDGATILNCYSDGDGGGIYVDGDNCTIWKLGFFHCQAGSDGGGIYVAYSADCQILDCWFEDCHCDLGGGVRSFGEDIIGFDGNTKIGECRSKSEFNDNFYHAKLMSTDAYNSALEAVQKTIESKNASEPAATEYSRPIISGYARNAITQNEYCDVIVPDLANEVESELGYFTLSGTTSYGMEWMIDYENPLTITAQEGYTIQRIEAIVEEGKQNYADLCVDNGTKNNLFNDPYYSGNAIGQNKILQIDDINSDSVTFTTDGNIYDNKAMQISDVIVYFSDESGEGAFAGSALSGGNLAIITAAAGLAIGVVSGIAIGKKQKKA